MRAVAIALLALLPAACAHQREEIREIHHQPPQVVEVVEVEKIVEVEKVVEVPAEPVAKPLRKPVESYDRIARYGKRSAPGGEM